MRKKWKKIIESSKEQIRKSYQQVEEKGGFPEIFGRERITEWGGTISGLHIIKDLSHHGDGNKIDSCLKSIMECQNTTTGAWGAGEIDLVEATSDIIYYLSSDFCDTEILKEPIEKAITFVKSRYCDEGYFKSNAFSNGTEHSLYSTFTAVRALKNVNSLNNTWELQIKQWIIDSEIDNSGLWGELPCSKVATICHSIYALMTLDLLGVPVKDQYNDEISKLYKLILQNSYPFEYEEYSFEKLEKDENGKNYDRVRINHFILPLAINFFIKIGDLAKAKLFVKVLINNNHGGKWGLYDTIHTVWATQQAIDAIAKFDFHDKDLIYHIECAVLWLYRNLTYVIIGVLVLSLILFIIIEEDFVSLVLSILVGICTGIIANMLTEWYRTGIVSRRFF